ncbi:hypothetical protein AA28_22880 [Salmonella enterica]|nr:hypothetical protein [Salmonella enterica]
MVKLTGSDRSRIQHLEKRLREALNRNGYHPPSGAGDNDYRSYQQKVMTYLRGINEPENNINAFLAETDRLYSGMFPSESELDWYRNDARASLWLACELYEELKNYGDEISVSALSPLSLQPAHNVRVDAIRRCIDDWPVMLFTPAYCLKEKSTEWAELMDRHNLFRDVSARRVDICSWLKRYLRENTTISLNRTCGDSPEEIMAWCYASYFIWRKNNRHSPDSVELFVRKFKNAWATQKNRIKNKVEKNLRPLNVHISQQAHDMLRDMSVKGGVSNDRIIESALTLMYDSKKRQ